MDQFSHAATFGRRPLAAAVSPDQFQSQADATGVQSRRDDGGQFTLTLYATNDDIYTDADDIGANAEAVAVSVNLVGGTQLHVGTNGLAHRKLIGASQFVAENVLDIRAGEDYSPYYLISFPTGWGIREVAALFDATVYEDGDGLFFDAEFVDYMFRIYDDGTAVPLHGDDWPNGIDVRVLLTTCNDRLEILQNR